MCLEMLRGVEMGLLSAGGAAMANRQGCGAGKVKSQDHPGTGAVDMRVAESSLRCAVHRRELGKVYYMALAVQQCFSQRMDR